jgi:aspartate/glutamate racemase
MVMIRQIGLLHTVGFLADMFRNLFQETIPDVNSFHIVDEGIIKQLMENEGLTPAIVRRIALQANLAVEAGADLILFTCSSTSPAVDTVRNLIDIPIMKIDDPLADKAVELGEKIGVITTAKTTLEPSINLISSRAAEKGKPVDQHIGERGISSQA